MKHNRILLTGAAGSLGTALRPYLGQLAEHVRLTDIKPLTDHETHEEFVAADLTDLDLFIELARDCDAVIHLSGIPVEDSWSRLLPANITGVYNLYEAVRANGRARVIYASTNHVMGFYPRTQRLQVSVPFRPDTLYAATKCFGESLASLYHDKFGIETLSIRIGSFRAAPEDRRMLATWVSAADTFALIERALAVPSLGNSAVYGVSANAESWWDNGEAAFLGWAPRDSAEQWREELFAREPVQDPCDRAVIYQGGSYVGFPHPDDKEAAVVAEIEEGR
ncbi:NAD(P)-dependent oxidoreductase [Nitratireductor sp. ZSWI3]|uniref:NAD-dependent epimerase/dehydratase family protein n=1 Tax=Nitratireductor sp. ZSWI3 TaxID=2966359 RepID=UPI00214FB320|nr:NAD(P)-dependent oxidoreductase [Nitratireductor sp. ZSWI3]MCR4265199.1 NAD(P)-dependent oxidoreductase [Nitratireductor sp. ZSWI3]